MRDEQERRTGGKNKKQTNRRMTTGEEALWTLVKTNDSDTATKPLSTSGIYI